MKFFTKQSSKTVAKRFAFLFLTMLAFGFTSNAQIPTFNEILKKYYNTDNLVVRTTAQTPPYGQQFENYTFEEWEDQETGGWFSKDFSEPTEWNSFMTADGSLSSLVSDQLSESPEKRPGSTGSKSARIFAKKTAGVVANGNMTNGRIYAGKMEANNDGNYNFTNTGDAKFNTQFTTIPDSLTVWVAFKPKDASKGNAKITTTIHGDTDLKQLAKSGNSPANMVCATADAEIAATSVWKRVTIPFTKGSHNDPRYILTTFNTNVTPGGGSEGDELYVDDICLIYNPTLNMELLAQTEYQYSGNGVTMNINVPFALGGSMSVYNLNKADNEVIAQLSDANGSFANPIELGRMTTNVSGTISGVIPADLPAGTGYKVRVVSTNYPMESNETNITISYPYVPVPQVEIALGNIAAKSASATFTPNVDCAQYYFLIANATESVNAAYVKANGQAKSGSSTETFENLTSDTEYKVYALPLTSDGVEGELAKVTLKTVALVPQITIAKGNVATKSIEATFTPNADCAQYYFLIANATETVDAAYVKANGENQTATLTKTWENVTSSTAYTVYALPIDVEGKEGELKSLNITTASFVPQIEIARDNFTSKTITTTFTPNGDCAQYYFLVALATETVDAAYIKANGENQTETYTTTFEGLTSNTAYVIYALPVDVDGFNGEIKSVTVTTKALAPQVTISEVNYTTKSATATFTPNADCVEYYFLIAKATETVDAAYVKENGVAKTETFATTFEDLISNTDYVIYALPIDVEGTEGALATLAVTTNAFTPQVEIARGNFTAKTITATFTPNTDCVEYYFLIANATETVDAEYIKANGEKQTALYTTTFEDLTSNTAYTIYALPVDADGFYGEVKTITVTTKALAPQVEITKGEVLTYSISASFAPNADCDQYYFLIADATGIVDAEYIMANGELKSESYAHTWENLMSNTNYTIYALPIDIEGNAGAVNTLVVKTKVEAGVSEVDIDVEKLNETTVTITATPNENTILYHYIIVTKAEADAMGEDALMQKLIENENYLDSVADVYTMTVESNVAYYVVAQGKNRDGEWGEVTKYEFVVAGPAAVAIAVEKVTETTVTVTATPNENTVSYEYIVIEKAEADAMDEDALLQKLAEANEFTGVDVYTYTVKSNVEYYVIAQAKNADGRLSEITKVEFVVAGPAIVAVEVMELSETSIFVMTPNEDAVSYKYIVITKAEADEMSEDALMAKLDENEEYLEGVKIRELVVEPNVAYYIVARAKNADDMWGAVTIVEYLYAEAGPASVAIEVKEVSETSVEVTATPNENTVSYKYIVITKAEADAMDAETLMQKLEAANELDAVDVWTYTVESNVEYYVIAQGKNADGNFGEMTKVEFVVRVAGEAALTVTVEEFTETSVLVITPNENTVAYRYIIIEKAVADSIGEDAVMQRLNENEDYLEGVTVEELMVEPNVEYYVIAQAKNADDVWGEVTKVEFIVIDENTGEDDGDSISELETVFEIYPNPASEYVRIKSNSDIESLMIFSIDGKLVYSEDVNQEETMIDVTAFAKGSYIVRMLSNDEFVIRRIVVK